MRHIVQRNLNIHEYQSKELMDKFGITTQKWRLVNTIDQAEEQAKSLGKLLSCLTYPCHFLLIKYTAAKEIVVKAQIHAGGRGKGFFKENNFKGGVKLCNTYVYNPLHPSFAPLPTS